MTTDNSISKLLVEHQQLLDEGNDYAYFQLAYTRGTGWMAWLRSHHNESQAKIAVKGQGETPEDACEEALDGLVKFPLDMVS